MVGTIEKILVWIGMILLCLFFWVAMFKGCVNAGQDKELTASWYSIESLKQEGTYKHSKGVMANGQLFSDYGFTCANNLYPLGAILRVTAIDSGKSVIVKTTDRIGKRFGKTRVDLSITAMEALAGEQGLLQGLIKVKVERIA